MAAMDPYNPNAPASPQSAANGLATMLAQLATRWKTTIDRIQPLLDQPVERMPYNLPRFSGTGAIGAGLTNQPLISQDFSHSLEWPFEVHAVKFSQDPAHTFRDWRVTIKDLSLNQDWQKNAVLVADLVDDNTGVWKLDYPWVVRPKGGALTVSVDNMDTVNPITVDINFRGYLLIPR